MHNIHLKNVDVEIQGEPKTISYQAQLIEIMRTPSSKGADLEEIRLSIRVLDKLAEARGTLTLEDADFEYMKQRVLATRWPIIDKYILSFIKDVTEAK